MKLYMFRTVHLSIIRSLFTVHSAMVYVRQDEMPETCRVSWQTNLWNWCIWLVSLQRN